MKKSTVLLLIYFLSSLTAYSGDLDAVVAEPVPATGAPVAPDVLNEPGLGKPVIDPIDIGTGGVAGGLRALGRSTATGVVLATEAVIGFVKGVTSKIVTSVATGTVKHQLGSSGNSGDGKQVPDQTPPPESFSMDGPAPIGPSGWSSFDPAPSLGSFGPSEPLIWSDNAPSHHLYDGGGGSGGGGSGYIFDAWKLSIQECQV